MRGELPKPEEKREKGEVDEKKLLELYIDFGTQILEGQMPSASRERLEEDYGNLELELLYLQHIDAITTSGDNVALKGSTERKAAKRLTLENYKNEKSLAEIPDNSRTPSYLLDPAFEPREKGYKPGNDLWMDPDDELLTKIFEAMEANEAQSVEEIQENIGEDLDFELGRYLKHLSTQEAVEEYNGEYVLNREEIQNRFFGEEFRLGEDFNNRERYENDPWKP